MTGDTNLEGTEMSLEDIMLADEGSENTEGAEGTPAADTQTTPEGTETAEEGGGTQPSEDGKPQEGTKDSSAAGDTKPGDAQQPAQTPQTVEVSFLGEKKALTIPELTQLAQKGLNYDHVVQQRDALKSSPAMQLVERMAAQNGMNPEQYIKHAQEVADARADETEVSKLTNEGMPREAAAELVRLRREAGRKAAEDQAAQAQRQQAETARQQAETAKQQDFAAFVKAYPDVKQLPQEVAQAVAAGESVMSAYQRYEIAQLRGQLAEKDATAAAQKKNEENKQKNPGSLSTSTTPEAPDPLDAALKEYGF